MYSKRHIEATRIASKSSVKPELAAVAFFGDKVLATDSFRAIEITVPEGIRTEKPVMLNAKVLRKRLKLDKDEKLSAEDMAAAARTVPVVGTFPDVEKIMNEAEARDSITISINAVYLAEMAAILSKVNKFGHIKMLIPKEAARPIVLIADGDTVKNVKQLSAKALIMPMNK